MPSPATLGAVWRAGRFAPAPAPDLTGETVPVEFAGFGALLVRGYFLKGLRHIDERYSQSWADAELALQVRRAGKKTLLAPAVRAIRHPDAPPDLSPAARALLAADFVLGAATYAGKHFGFLAGLKIRVAAVLHALASFQFTRLRYLLEGQKIDGTQE
jgi:hypothetical protein